MKESFEKNIKNPKLLNKLREMETEELAKLTKKPEENPTVSSDEVAEKQESDEEDSASGEVVSETLGRIRQAIIWAEKGHAGECFICNNEIPEKRLGVLPYAMTCTEHMDEETMIRMEDVLAK